MKRMIVTLAAACGSLTLGCVNLTPAESCQAICSEMTQCQIAITGSSLTAGASCETSCLSKIETEGDSCKTSAAYLADCFKTYTCSGIEVSCSTYANEFANDCH
jgi:hypothetical protein